VNEHLTRVYGCVAGTVGQYSRRAVSHVGVMLLCIFPLFVALCELKWIEAGSTCRMNA
jgi:hypothetical protein